MIDDDIGIESAGNPCQRSSRWNWEKIFWRSLSVVCATYLALMFMPDGLRHAINGSSPVERIASEPEVLAEICESMNGGMMQIPVRVPGIRRKCTIYYQDGTTVTRETM
jgi:hypothetical protein